MVLVGRMDSFVTSILTVGGKKERWKTEGSPMVISSEQGSKIAKLKAQERLPSTIESEEESLRDRYRKSDYFKSWWKIQRK